MTTTDEINMPTRLPWLIACLDSFGRARGLAVLGRNKRVALVTPAGGTAVLTAGQTRRLNEVIKLAAAGVRPPIR
ncbi:MAG TPA: hypothetical protein VF444_12030 [Pseudonocardiaceae bacterium]